MGKVAEKLTGNSKSFVDVEGSVEVGVVDETLPADRRSGFLDQVASATGGSH